MKGGALDMSIGLRLRLGFRVRVRFALLDLVRLGLRFEQEVWLGDRVCCHEA